MKHFKTKEDFFNNANDRLKQFIKKYVAINSGEDHTLNMHYLSSALIECGFRYVTFDNKALNDIYKHYAGVIDESDPT
ncbi:hypothetical protein AAS21_gp041 [Pantoea phage vB_PagS_AAS21]|uniref:Uncharacterized protein n=1 Tax=Pantoea phage vB_PagS_AAS21 TaxID=2575261 RepID=A0A4Y5P1E8_9CAUD|nr:hypothetical protein AAS21_gp041 [Pantoea phage vB_PagS_AAS21]